MAIHSSIPAWRIPKDRGAWPATVYGSHRVGQDWVTKQSSGYDWHIRRRSIGTELLLRSYESLPSIQFSFFFEPFKDWGEIYSKISKNVINLSAYSSYSFLTYTFTMSHTSCTCIEYLCIHNYRCFKKIFIYWKLFILYCMCTLVAQSCPTLQPHGL